MAARRYRCPECGSTLVVFVKPTQPPTCQNPGRHSNKPVEMTQQGARK